MRPFTNKIRHIYTDLFFFNISTLINYSCHIGYLSLESKKLFFFQLFLGIRKNSLIYRYDLLLFFLRKSLFFIINNLINYGRILYISYKTNKINSFLKTIVKENKQSFCLNWINGLLTNFDHVYKQVITYHKRKLYKNMVIYKFFHYFTFNRWKNQKQKLFKKQDKMFYIDFFYKQIPSLLKLKETTGLNSLNLILRVFNLKFFKTNASIRNRNILLSSFLKKLLKYTTKMKVKFFYRLPLNDYIFPSIILILDPRISHWAVEEAWYLKIPTISFFYSIFKNFRKIFYPIFINNYRQITINFLLKLFNRSILRGVLIRRYIFILDTLAKRYGPYVKYF